VYSAYTADAAKRRAWSADNAGNREIRTELVDTLVSVLGPAMHGPLLDVGCGSGWLLRTFAGLGIAPEMLFGVDLLEHRVDVARRQVPQARIDCADARSLPFADGSFALVTLVTVLSSVESSDLRQTVLTEAARVAGSDGLVMTYDPRVPNPLNRQTALVRRTEAQDAGLETRWSGTLTVIPPLSRRLGRTAPRTYRALARLPALRTHRLNVLQSQGTREAPR